MPTRHELWCPHCKRALEYPSRCRLEVDEQGTQRILGPGERARAEQFRVGLPSICLRCGQLGVHRADTRRCWRCDTCGGRDLRQLGLDTRSTALIVALLLGVVLVVLPGTSSVVWSLPGIATLGLLGTSWWQLERQGRADLGRAPCVLCGKRGVRERPAQ